MMLQRIGFDTISTFRKENNEDGQVHSCQVIWTQNPLRL